MDDPKSKNHVVETEDEELLEPSEIFKEGMELLQEIVDAAMEEGKSLNKAVNSKRRTVLGIQKVLKLFARVMRIATVTFGRYEAALRKLSEELAALKLEYGIEDEEVPEPSSEEG